MVNSTFNADFYTVVATILPILMLAVTAFGFTNSQFAPMIHRPTKLGKMHRTRIFLASALCIAPFILGIDFEWDALSALNLRLNLSTLHNTFIIWVSMVLMIIAVSGIIENALNAMISEDLKNELFKSRKIK